ncbi:methyltransferase type 11 [Methylobacterium frigidaeris]|nr:methyltransferase type 11 [Methylobacterium frigidaeris]
MDVNGSLRDHIDAGDVYLGLDVEHGKSVDLVIDPLKPLPLRDGFADIVLSSSQMEHDKFFWKTFLELIRVTKNGGYIYISSPSNGDYHSYPIDCWRFYPEAGLALSDWANANGLPCTLIESFTAGRKNDNWNDYVAIFQKCPPELATPGERLSNGFTSYNVRTLGSDEVANRSDRTEDFLLIAEARQRLAAAQDEIRALNEKIEVLERDLRAANARDVDQHGVREAADQAIAE